MATTTVIVMTASFLIVAIACGLAGHYLVGSRPSKAGAESEAGS